MHSYLCKFLCLVNILICFYYVSGENKISIPMRVVKDTASYGYFGNNGYETETHQLQSAVKPSNFSGPSLLKRLDGNCYNLTQDSYRYVFCPFQNVTQYEISARWNPYQGVLGVWNEWNIENNTFHSMIYSSGDHCGDIDRSVEVFLQCGPNEILSNVTEPKRCQYAAVFLTKYVCHNDALLVYPRLSEDLRKQWDRLLTEFHYGDITEKGYEIGLKKIFKKAGYSGSTTAVIKPTNNSTSEQELAHGTAFSDLVTCNKEYASLQKEISRMNREIESLKVLLDLRAVQNRTNKPHR